MDINPSASGVSMLICVILFWGVTSFEPIGLSRFKHIEDSFANCLSGTLIGAGAFATGIKGRKKIFSVLKEKIFF